LLRRWERDGDKKEKQNAVSACKRLKNSEGGIGMEDGKKYKENHEAAN